MLAPRPTPKLEDHPSSAVRGCLFYLFTATLHIGGRSSIRNLRMRHAVVTGTRIHGYGSKQIFFQPILSAELCRPVGSTSSLYSEGSIFKYGPDCCPEFLEAKARTSALYFLSIYFNRLPFLRSDKAFYRHYMSPLLPRSTIEPFVEFHGILCGR